MTDTGAGKGSRPRPRNVDWKEWERRHKQAFPTKPKETDEDLPEREHSGGHDKPADRV